MAAQHQIRLRLKTLCLLRLSLRLATTVATTKSAATTVTLTCPPLCATTATASSSVSNFTNSSYSTEQTALFGLSSSNQQDSGYFGSTVGMSAGVVVVGAPIENASGIPSAGHAYIFNATNGVEIKALTSPNPQPGGRFGSEVAAYGDYVLVGAQGEGNGNAYLYNGSTGGLLRYFSSPESISNTSSNSSSTLFSVLNSSSTTTSTR